MRRRRPPTAPAAAPKRAAKGVRARAERVQSWWSGPLVNQARAMLTTTIANAPKTAPDKVSRLPMSPR
jgi:hypothetical protein